MKQLLSFARRFRMDNPLVEFGSDVYQPDQPINLCYDTFGPPAAMIRGLFEYLYHADGLATACPTFRRESLNWSSASPSALAASESTSRRPGQGQSPACWSTASRGRVLTPRAFRCLMKISRK